MLLMDRGELELANAHIRGFYGSDDEFMIAHDRLYVWVNMRWFKRVFTMRVCVHACVRVYACVLPSHGYAHVYYTSVRGIIHTCARVCACVCMNRYTLPRRVYLFSCVRVASIGSLSSALPACARKNFEARITDQNAESESSTSDT